MSTRPTDDGAEAGSEQDGAASGLRRVLGPVDATCVVVGAIIGVGIFFTPSRIAEIAGSGGLALVAWAVGGGIALMGALTFAELGGLYPRTGGQYEILRDAYGPLPAFLYVFCNATAIQGGAIAIIAFICTRHLGLAVGREIESPVVLVAASSVLIVGLAGANTLGVRWGAGIQNVTVFAKVLTLLVVTLIAVFAPSAPPATPETLGQAGLMGIGVVGAIAAALVPAFFSFGGWQHALWIAGEVRRPHRNVPLSIVGGVILVVTVYLLVNWAYLELLGYEGVTTSQGLASDAVATVWPGAGARFIAAAVAVSAFGVLNAQLLSGPRLIHGMALDGRFFKPFAGVSVRFGTPAPAIALLAGVALVLLVAAGERVVDRLLTGVVLIDGVFFALTGAALFVLRHKRPEAVRPVRVLAYPVVPLLFVVGELGVVIGAYLDPTVRQAALIGAAWIAVAGLCYLVFFRGERESPAPDRSSPLG